MKTFIAVLALIGVAFACSDLGDDVFGLRLNQHWETFKQVHHKKYSPREEVRRKSIFAKNLKFIAHHNVEADLNKHTFTLGVNQFADMETTEWAEMVNGFKANPNRQPMQVYEAQGLAVPDTMDWRDKGLVAEVKNQGQCGSCWAFSAVASLEGQHANATGKMVELSEQNLVDCSQAEGNEGCNGGLMDSAFEYIKKNNGIDTEQSYPYQGADEKCRFNSKNVGATLKGWVDIKSGDENALKEATATIGPISVAIDASSIFFQLYRSGILFDPFCKNGPNDLDHGVTVVGYGNQNGKDFWLVKNSWGASWGQKGYLLMQRNKNNKCGIATQASYPLV